MGNQFFYTKLRFQKQTTLNIRPIREYIYIYIIMSSNIKNIESVISFYEKNNFLINSYDNTFALKEKYFTENIDNT